MEKNITTITLEEVINMCLSYHNQEVSAEEFHAFVETIYIRKYLPISTKSLLVNYILLCDDFLGIDEESVVAIEIELKKFYRIMLAYTNITVDDRDDLMTMANYDLIMMYLGDAIESFCGVDYRRTINLLDNVINFANINRLMEQELLLSNNREDIDTKLKNALYELDQRKDLVDKIAGIIKFNKPVIEDAHLKSGDKM